ncbi:BrnT family toxin [Candidatus Kaiserbacteria bacterium]|nr:BrnT family toxin [Candidatus Kaiserbacteria bacterium]
MVEWALKGEGHAFDWDKANAKKCQKHGISIAEIESLFASVSIVYPDLKHSDAEARYSAIGRTSTGRGAFVVFTFRERDGMRLIRPISARYMHKEEINYYESL